MEESEHYVKKGIFSTLIDTTGKIVVSSIENYYKKKIAEKNREHETFLQANKYREESLLEYKKSENQLALNKEIIKESHRARLKEQKDYFLRWKGQMDYDFFLKHSWPLISPPEMLPHSFQNADLNSGQIPLLIICTGYPRKIAPIIESAINKLDQVLTSIDRNPKNHDQRTLLYTGGWRNDGNFKHLSGRAVVDILHNVLKGYPTLVLQPIYYEFENKISFNSSFWGLGSVDPPFTKNIFDISYSETSTTQEEKSVIVNKITAELAIITISVSDTYHLLEYNAMPQFRHLLEYKDIFNESLIPVYSSILPVREIFSAWALLNNGDNLILTPEIGAAFLNECISLSNIEDKTWVIKASNDLLNRNIPFKFLFADATKHDILFDKLEKNYQLLSILNELAWKCNLDYDSEIIEAWKFYINNSNIFK